MTQITFKPYGGFKDDSLQTRNFHTGLGSYQFHNGRVMNPLVLSLAKRLQLPFSAAMTSSQQNTADAMDLPIPFVSFLSFHQQIFREGS